MRAHLKHAYVLVSENATSHHSRMLDRASNARVSSVLVDSYESGSLSQDLCNCWDPSSKIGTRSRNRVLSMGMKHSLATWHMFQTGQNVSVVLEDDAQIDPAVFDYVEEVVAQGLEWDLIVLDTCVLGTTLRMPPHLASLTTLQSAKSLAWSYTGAKKMLESLPLNGPVDVHINAAIPAAHWRVYCLAQASM